MDGRFDRQEGRLPGLSSFQWFGLFTSENSSAVREDVRAESVIPRSSHLSGRQSYDQRSCSTRQGLHWLQDPTYSSWEISYTGLMTRLAVPDCSRLDLSFSSLLDAAARKPSHRSDKISESACTVRDRKVVLVAKVRHNFDSNERDDDGAGDR